MKKFLLLLIFASILLAVGITQIDWVAKGQGERTDQIYGIIRYNDQAVNDATAFLKAGAGYTGGDYDQYDVSHSQGRYGFSGLSAGWYTVWADKGPLGKRSDRVDVYFNGASAEEQDLDLDQNYRSKIYGTVTKNFQPCEGATVEAWAIRTSDSDSTDFGSDLTDANGDYEFAWDDFYIAYPADQNATYYCKATLSAKGEPESRTRSTNDPYPSSQSSFTWHTSPEHGWWWHCNFGFK